MLNLKTNDCRTNDCRTNDWRTNDWRTNDIESAMVAWRLVTPDMSLISRCFYALHDQWRFPLQDGSEFNLNKILKTRESFTFAKSKILFFTGRRRSSEKKYNSMEAPINKVRFQSEINYFWRIKLFGSVFRIIIPLGT